MAAANRTSRRRSADRISASGRVARERAGGCAGPRVLPLHAALLLTIVLRPWRFLDSCAAGGERSARHFARTNIGHKRGVVIPEWGTQPVNVDRVFARIASARSTCFAAARPARRHLSDVTGSLLLAAGSLPGIQYRGDTRAADIAAVSHRPEPTVPMRFSRARHLAWPGCPPIAPPGVSIRQPDRRQTCLPRRCWSP